jgi:GDPmannose 4,6-dehydratase
MKALITGVTGQDGHYLSEYLQEKGWLVFGLIRRTSSPPKIPKGVIPIEGDVTDPSTVDLIDKLKPNHVYNLAGQSYVWESFQVPQTTFDINCIGSMNVLEGARRANARFYQASTSEMFGTSKPPHNENTPFHPRSPYGAAKLAAHWMTVNYREAYGMYSCAGILFNHESPLRGHVFLSQKAATAAARIYLGKDKDVTFGNLKAKRDWGHAKDYVRGMYLMLTQLEPKEVVFATGKNHTAEEFVDLCFKYVGLDYREFVKYDQKYERPSEIPELLGDPTEARKLGWEPEYSFEDLVKEMVEAALERESK